jgi:4-amino-4-deoxy-L-arabinose transferase-like glycosyltransferase
MTDSRVRALATLVVFAGIAAWVFWSRLGANEIVGGDEGYYGVMAQSILVEPRRILSPPLSPLGPPGDKPPLYPALLAGSIRLFGSNELALRWPSEAAALAIALMLAALLARIAGAPGALAAAGLFVSLPWLADASRVCAAEPALTAFGAGAAVLATAPNPSRGRDALAGALLGAGFLCKLWLVGLIALPVALALAPWTRGGARRLALVAGVALATASLHLVAVARFEPAAFAHWRDVTFGFSLASRARGEGYASSWLLPPGAYWNLLGRALVLLAPLVAIGVVRAAWRWHEPVARLLLSWAAGAALLSLFAVKAGGYAYVIMPAWVGLAALGLAALSEGTVRSRIAPLIGAFLGAPPIVAAFGGPRASNAAWAAAIVATLVAWWVAHTWPTRARQAALALGLVLAAVGLVREAQRLPQRYHDPGYRDVAEALRPELRRVPPERLCFVAPEAPALAFYLFRTGRYWGTPIRPWTEAEAEAVRSNADLRAFVVDTERELYGGWPDSATVSWLEQTKLEITPDPLGALEPRLRVFVAR